MQKNIWLASVLVGSCLFLNAMESDRTPVPSLVTLCFNVIKKEMEVKPWYAAKELDGRLPLDIKEHFVHALAKEISPVRILKNSCASLEAMHRLEYCVKLIDTYDFFPFNQDFEQVDLIAMQGTWLLAQMVEDGYIKIVVWDAAQRRCIYINYLDKKYYSPGQFCLASEGKSFVFTTADENHDKKAVHIIADGVHEEVAPLRAETINSLAINNRGELIVHAECEDNLSCVCVFNERYSMYSFASKNLRQMQIPIRLLPAQKAMPTYVLTKRSIKTLLTAVALKGALYQMTHISSLYLIKNLIAQIADTPYCWLSFCRRSSISVPSDDFALLPTCWQDCLKSFVQLT